MSNPISDEIEAIIQKVRFHPITGIERRDIDVLRRVSEGLSVSEKADFLEDFVTPAGHVIFDPVCLFDAQIQIDFYSIEKRYRKPLAYVIFSDGYQARVEVIDILQSIRVESQVVGHPIVSFAIATWQSVIRGSKYSMAHNAGQESPSTANLKQFRGGPIKAAKYNLSEIQSLVIKGSESGAVSTEIATSLQIAELDLESRDTYLYAAWERLSRKFTRPTNDPMQRIDDIESYLVELAGKSSFVNRRNLGKKILNYRFVKPGILIADVISFLRTDGIKYVYAEDGKNFYKNLRPNWRVFSNSFASWHTGKATETIKKYKRRSLGQLVENFEVLDLLTPLPQKNVFRILKGILALPLAQYCLPFTCPDSVAESFDLSDWVEKQPPLDR